MAPLDRPDSSQGPELSRTTVHRIWQAFGLQPHVKRHFKLSTEPVLVEKVRDIAGLLPQSTGQSDGAVCGMKKSEIQALDRTQPRLFMGLGYLEGVLSRLRPEWYHQLFCWR